jgi:tRNA pseudouridine38-40 synthase
MRRAAAVFLGTHDFSSFATRSNFVPRSTVRTVTRLELATDATDPSRVSLVIEADAFLYKMVRNVVRALAKAGEGRCTPDDLGAMLRARDRQAAPGSAPASGLYLDAVYYDDAAPAGQPAPSILRRPEPS